MIKEYIDRGEALMKLMQDGCSAKNVESIMNIPAADVVPVVRCKDCVYYDFEKGCPLRESGYSRHGKPLPHENDFCSYGEMRNNNG